MIVVIVKILGLEVLEVWVDGRDDIADELEAMAAEQQQFGGDG